MMASLSRTFTCSWFLELGWQAVVASWSDELERQAGAMSWSFGLEVESWGDKERL
jgi:hypothetical protein